MKKEYVAPELITIEFEIADIITNSDATSGSNTGTIIIKPTGDMPVN